MKTSYHVIFFSPLFFNEKRKWVWLIRNRVLRVQPVFVRFKSSGNQTGFNRRKPGNRFGRLTWAYDRSIPKTRPIEGSGIELMRSTDLGLFDQHMLRIFSLLWIYLSGSNGFLRDRSIPLRKKASNFSFFWGFLNFLKIILVKNYILIFNNCFINCNFEFLIEIKGCIVILKIFRLIYIYI